MCMNEIRSLQEIYNEKCLQISSRTNSMQGSKSTVDFNCQCRCELANWFFREMNGWDARRCPATIIMDITCKLVRKKHSLYATMPWFNRLMSPGVLLVNKGMGIGPQKQNCKHQNRNVTN